MHTLTISDNDECEILKMEMPECDPIVAVSAILAALSALPKPKKPRADKGKKRTPALTP